MGREQPDGRLAIDHVWRDWRHALRTRLERPPDLTDDNVRSAPVGHYFNVITNGFGAMPDHAAQIKVRDRWAIAAYLRALQASASVSVNDIPPAERARLEAAR